MSAQEPAKNSAPPPHAQLIEMGHAFMVSRLVYAAAKLGLADHLSPDPKSAAEIAGKLGVNPSFLHRFMRTLASLGILTERGGQRFALTQLGEALRTGAPGSARATILSFGNWGARSFQEIMHSLTTGGTGMQKAFNARLFDYLAAHPEAASHFSETMVGFHGAEPPAVAAAYDFSIFGSIIDVGGATGNMLSEILVRHAKPRGVLYDRPYVVTEATAFLQKHGVADRVTVEPGDFFKSVPAGGDAYILSHIIHDWNEEECLTILGNIRRAMKPTSRLLIVEMVLPHGDTPHPGKMLDMVMMVVVGGQERTAEEYGTLLAKAGLKMTGVVPTASAVSIVEAVPV